MRKILFLCLIIFGLSCKKSVQVNPNRYYVEDFRKPGMTDYEVFKAAYDSIPDNSELQFADRAYIFNHTPTIYKKIDFYGPAVITRENQIAYSLKDDADQNSTFLILNSTKGIINTERVIVCLNQKNDGATSIDVVNKINGDTIYLEQPLGATFGGGTNYPAGSSLFKNINLFWVVSPTSFPEVGCRFINLTFDGNRENNKGSYSWNFNTAILAVNNGYTYYKGCKFLNSPNESIAGHNADIENCTFLNLNGSAFHTSLDKQIATEDQIHSYVLNNSFENTNQISNLINGHSEGAITHSNSGGYYTATGNTFKNVGEAVLGTLYPSVSVHDWGTSNITFTGNTIDGANRMVYGIALIPGAIHDVKIEKNTISNLTGTDWSAQLGYWPGIILKNKSGE
ncbi:MAG: hypothetical protein ABI691_05135 [Ginsengibacter sp.]